MNKFYQWYIVAKYNFYKIYWKFKKPTKVGGFYDWTEIGLHRLNNKGIAVGIIDKKL